jgi:hypothetical protein
LEAYLKMSAQLSVVPIDYRKEDLSRKKFYSVSFAGQDLTKCNLRNSLFFKCNFDSANLTEANCEGSEFTGSSFRGTNCYRTNFRNAKLAATIFEPSDAMGMTITLECKALQDMRVSPLYFYAWLIFALMLHPIGIATPIKDDIIAAIGAERYVKLKALFAKREI